MIRMPRLSLDLPAIEVTDLRKRYGQIEALAGLTMTVGPRRGLRLPRPERRRQDDDGQAPARAGPPDRRQRARSSARRSATSATRRKIGYLPELFRYQPWLKAREVLTLHGELMGLPRARRGQAADEALATRRARRSARRPRRAVLEGHAAAARAGRRAPRRAGAGRSSTSRRRRSIPSAVIDVRGIVRAAAERGTARLPELAPAERGRAGLRPGRDHRPRPGRRQRRRSTTSSARPRRRSASRACSASDLRGDRAVRPADARGRPPDRSGRWIAEGSRARRPARRRWAPGPRGALGPELARAALPRARRPRSPAGRHARAGTTAAADHDDRDRQADHRRGRPTARPVGPRRPRAVAVSLTALGRLEPDRRARDSGVTDLEIKFAVSQILIFIAFMFGFVLVMTAAFFGSPAIADRPRDRHRPGDARPAAGAGLVPARPLARPGRRHRRLRRRRPGSSRSALSAWSRATCRPTRSCRWCTSPARRSSCCRSRCSCRPACRRSRAARSRSSPTGWRGWPASSGKIGLALGHDRARHGERRVALSCCPRTRCGRASSTASSRRFVINAARRPVRRADQPVLRGDRPSTAIVAWSAIWVVLVLALAVTQLRRREL